MKVQRPLLRIRKERNLRRKQTLRRTMQVEQKDEDEYYDGEE